jgi:outer membrane protein assembly factor BamD
MNHPLYVSNLRNPIYMRTFFFHFAIFIILLSTSASSKLAKVLKEPDYNKRYEAALAYYESEDYARAGIVFEDIIPDIYGKSLAEKVQFYYAYCHFHQKQYDLADYYFKSFYDTYRRSPFATEAYFMRAYSLYQSTPQYNLDQSNTNSAIEALQDFINTYPESSYTAKATEAIRDLRAKLELKNFEVAKLYQRLRRYKSAVIAYNTFRQSYPDSKYKEEALFNRIECQYELAKLSIPSLKRERYEELGEFYIKFIDKYPNSQYLRDAENFYNSAQKRLQELAEIEAKAPKAAKEE